MPSQGRSAEIAEFNGFQRPNYTPVPDELFDHLLPILSGAELRLLLYIIRRTFGFKKDRDAISFNQFLRGISAREGRVLDRGCGIRDRTTLSRALRTLEDKQVIVAYRGVDEKGEKEATLYALRFAHSEDGEAGQMGVVGISYHPGRQTRPPVVGKAYLQETVMQDTDRQETEQQQHTAEQLVVALSGLGVTRKVACEIVRRYPKDRIMAQIEMLPYRAAKDPPAVLVRAVREDWAPPAGYATPEQGRVPGSEQQLPTDIQEERTCEARESYEVWRKRAIQEYAIDQGTQQLWARAQAFLVRFVGQSVYRQLFSEALMTVPRDGPVRILVPHSWQRSHIRAEHRKALQKAIVMASGREMHFQVDLFASSAESPVETTSPG